MAQRMNGVAETFDVFGNKVSGTSVRVHAPPGGGSSFSLGGNYYGEDNAVQQPRRAVAAFPGGPTEEELKQEDQRTQQVAAGSRPAAGTNQQPAHGAVPANSMQGVEETFDVYGNKVKGTSVRVHAPPGGKSSI